MEVSPRAGGNRLAEMLNYAADVNIIEAEVRKAVGLPIQEIHEPNYRGHFAIHVLHTEREGLFESLELEETFREKHLIEEEIRVHKNDKVMAFTGANASIGTFFLRFDTRKELEVALSNPEKWMRVKVK